jgi:CheY-like chemotaxis protein/predicted transcriptional regulator
LTGESGGTKDIAGSFSFEVTKRILEALEASGPMKKTNLATKTGLNYNVCLRYVNMLKLLEWIDVTSDKWNYVSITEIGRQVKSKLLNTAVVNAVMPQIKTPQPEEFKTRQKMDDANPLARKQRSNLSIRGHLTHKSYSIMVVDDEPDIPETYKSFLSLEGYNVKAFSDAYSALRDFAARPSYYDLVILDIRMPDINGFQIYQSLKAMNPSCKIIFITALDAAKEMVSILPGVTYDDILRKPVDKDFFLKRISDALAH